MANKLIEIKGEPFIVDLMYARSDNMTGHAVYQEIGFGNQALVHPDVWKCLQNTIPILEKHHLKMKIYDAYRPPLAHKRLLDIIPQEGFFARSPELSQHCRGTAVDVALTDEKGNEFLYPTNVDGYTPAFAEDVKNGNTRAFFQHLKFARHDYDDATPKALENRRFLCRLMADAGLVPLAHEWWHYNLPNGKNDNYPLIEWPFADK